MKLVEDRLLGPPFVVEPREISVAALVDIIQSGLHDQRPRGRTPGRKAELKPGLFTQGGEIHILKLRVSDDRRARQVSADPVAVIPVLLRRVTPGEREC